jgi:hypothetical protein
MQGKWEYFFVLIIFLINLIYFFIENLLTKLEILI